MLNSVEHDLLVLFGWLFCLVLLWYVLLCYVTFVWLFAFLGLTMFPLLEVFCGGIDSGKSSQFLQYMGYEDANEETT